MPTAFISLRSQNQTEPAHPHRLQGAATVRQLMPEVVTIFLAAESEAALVHRLVGRATEAPEKVVTRVETARAELRR